MRGKRKGGGVGGMVLDILDFHRLILRNTNGWNHALRLSD